MNEQNKPVVVNETRVENEVVHKVKPINSKKKRISWITGTAIFAALSVILYITKVPPFVFPIFPPPFNFLEINFSEVPALIAGFAYGPFSAFIVLLIRLLIKLPMTSTLMIGEIADVIYSSSFVITASLIYKYRRTFKGVLTAFGIAFVVQLAVSALANYFVVYTLYNNLIFSGHIPFTANQFIVYVLPFNAIKNTVIGVIVLLVYKRISKFINSFSE